MPRYANLENVTMRAGQNQSFNITVNGEDMTGVEVEFAMETGHAHYVWHARTDDVDPKLEFVPIGETGGRLTGELPADHAGENLHAWGEMLPGERSFSIDFLRAGNSVISLQGTAEVVPKMGAVPVGPGFSDQTIEISAHGIDVEVTINTGQWDEARVAALEAREPKAALDAASFADQFPTVLDTGMVIDFDSSENNEWLQFVGPGLIQIKKRSWLVFDLTLSLARTGSIGDVHNKVRAMVGGLSETPWTWVEPQLSAQPGETVSIVRLAMPRPRWYNPGETIHFELMQDSAGVLDGGLRGKTANGAWAQSPSAALSVVVLK